MCFLFFLSVLVSSSSLLISWLLPRKRWWWCIRCPESTKSGQLTSAASLFRSSSFLLHLWSEVLLKVLLYPQEKVATAWIANLFFLQRGGGHRPEGSLLPSGRKRHVYPDGPAGHCSGQIDQLQHMQYCSREAEIWQLLSGAICVTPAFHVCGPSSSFKAAFLRLVTLIVISFHCTFSTLDQVLFSTL